MALDLDLYRQKLLDRRAELQREDESVVADRAPVALDQESVGRLSRIDAMQVPAMALAQQRLRPSERTAIDAALLRLDEDAFGYSLEDRRDGEEYVSPCRRRWWPDP